MKSIEQLAGFADRAALDAIRHQRRRRLRDGASRPLERDVGDAVVFNLHEHRDAVATEWIVALRMVAGAVEAVEVPRPPVVVEDDLLIQVGQIGHWISASSFPLPASRASSSPLPASGGPAPLATRRPPARAAVPPPGHRRPGSCCTSRSTPAR